METSAVRPNSHTRPGLEHSDLSEHGLRWLTQRRRQQSFTVTQIPFARLNGWSFTPDGDSLVHRSGRFFSVEGTQVSDRRGNAWCQPIIRQEDIAILGILTRDGENGPEFLMQAKMEPGNLGFVQLSPTVQSTPSNYSRAHAGKTSRYVEHFLDNRPEMTVVDRTQSEQGSWFLKKKNRNVVVEIENSIKVHDDFCWLGLNALYSMLSAPHVLNMDTRTVLSNLPLELLLAHRTKQTDRALGVGDHAQLHSDAEVEDWLQTARLSSRYEVQSIPLTETATGGWVHGDHEIAHKSGRWFRILGADITTDSREVTSWSQPLLAPSGLGLVAMLTREINGAAHVLVKADTRPGYESGVEIGPTVQCTPSNYRLSSLSPPPYLDAFQRAHRKDILHDSLQSEEGGRFYRAATRHVVMADPSAQLEEPPGYMWITIRQFEDLIASGEVNIEARSLFLCLAREIHGTMRGK